MSPRARKRRLGLSALAGALAVLPAACGGDDRPPIPRGAPAPEAAVAAAPSAGVLFRNDFSAAEDVDALFAPGRWTNRKLTHEDNRLSLERRDGRDALAAYAVPEEDPVSKASILHQGFDLREGDAVRIEARLLLEPGGPAEDVFLMDVECTDCWPAIALVSNQSPGVRLALRGPEGRLAIDRGKIGFRDEPFLSDATLPRGRWIDLAMELRLSEGEDGEARVYVDDALVLEATGATLPPKSEFRRRGIFLRQSRYDYLEIGLTANAGDAPHRLLIDEVTVRRL